MDGATRCGLGDSRGMRLARWFLQGGFCRVCWRTRVLV